MHICSAKHSPRREAGATLIEILVAMLILSLGVLGMGALQTRAIKGNNSSVQRSQAVMLTYAMMDAMRLDKAVASAQQYDTGTFDAGTGKIDNKICAVADITGTALKDNNRRAWLTALKKNMGTPTDTTSCGAIDCDTDGNCRVQVFWDDELSGGLGEQMIETVSRL